MNRNHVHLALSGLGVILGFMAFVAFFFIIGNHRAGSWALFSAIFAAAYFHLAWLNARGDLLQWHDHNSLNLIKTFSFVVGVISTGMLAWYLFEDIYYKESLIPYNESSFLAAVWTFMSAKWSLGLFFRVRKYISMHYSQ